MEELNLVEDLFSKKGYLSLIFGFEDVRVQGIHLKGVDFIKFPEDVNLASSIVRKNGKSKYEVNTESLCYLIILVNNVYVQGKLKFRK